MISRWTDFLISDGEKLWRNRDDEFLDDIKLKDELLCVWNNGWEVLFNTLSELTEEDLNKISYIRNEGHTVTEYVNRQLCQYSFRKAMRLGISFRPHSARAISFTLKGRG